MGKPEPYEKLLDNIRIEATITCNCGYNETVWDLDEWQAVEHFYKKGWRVRNLIHCPSCAKKKLKDPSK